MIFLNSASSAAALVFYLPFSGPSMMSSVHTERGQSPEYISKFSKKNPQYLMNTPYINIYNNDTSNVKTNIFCLGLLKIQEICKIVHAAIPPFPTILPLPSPHSFSSPFLPPLLLLVACILLSTKRCGS